MDKLIKVSDLPNLHEIEPALREMSSEYWTPEAESEYKVGVILEIKQETFTDEETGETVELPCMIMFSQEQDKTFTTIRNGSKRLVATIEGALESGEIVAGQTPIRITYLGKKKNKTNSRLSDRWSVKAIQLNKKL